MRHFAQKRPTRRLREEAFTGASALPSAAAESFTGDKKKRFLHKTEQRKRRDHGNEGETEKAQELYNQIRALSKQAETKE